jgi:hypothetical protein
MYQPLEALGLSVPCCSTPGALGHSAMAKECRSRYHCVEMSPFDELEHEFIVREARLSLIT